MDLEGERLHRDVHPAEVLLPDERVLTGLRVFITSHRLLAYRARPDRRIEPAVSLELARPCTVPADRGSLFGRLEVRLADGTTAWVNAGAGCGCGSPLKALASPVGWTPRTEA